MRFHICVEATFDSGLPIGFEAHLDAVMGILADTADDPAISLDEFARVVLVELDVEGADMQAAMNRGLSTLRAAIHGADGETAGWEQLFTEFRANPVKADGHLLFL